MKRQQTKKFPGNLSDGKFFFGKCAGNKPADWLTDQPTNQWDRKQTIVTKIFINKSVLICC